MVNIRLVLEVTQYHADVYYNSKTGERIHAQFPAGVTDEVNYGESIKAFLSLLNNECCTSLDKSRRFLSDLTDSNHDHDVTYYSYGSGHQECLAHILRYLKDSIQNEPERTWNIQMRTLIQEMIHYRNGLDSSEECSTEKSRSLRAATVPYSRKRRRNTNTFQQMTTIRKDITCTCVWNNTWKTISCSCMITEFRPPITKPRGC